MSISSKALIEIVNKDAGEGGMLLEDLNEATIKYRVKQKSNLSVDDLKSDILNRDNNMLPYIKAKRKRVIVVTPFIREDMAKRHKIERYTNYAMVDSLNQNEAPISNQSMYLNLSGYSGTNLERDVSFIVQLNWMPKAEIVAFYVDYGITPAMESLMNYCIRKNIKTEIRSIGEIEWVNTNVM